MKESKTTTSVAWLILAFYVLYAIFGIGFNGLLFSVAVGLISYSMTDNILIVAAITIFSGILWRTVISARVMDAFADVVLSKNADGTAAFPQSRVEEIVKRVTGMGEKELKGVMSSFSEGFADAGALDAPRPDAGSDGKESGSETGQSKPAKTEEPTVSKEMKASAPNSDAAKAIETASDKALPKIGVQENKVPEETKKDGIHLDAASTLMSAFKNLDKGQIEAMTSDTRALLETQKSLMGMLQSMKPILSDGQQMMSTFQGMFGSPAK